MTDIDTMVEAAIPPYLEAWPVGDDAMVALPIALRAAIEAALAVRSVPTDAEIEAAEKLGYRCHHETDSRKSKGGFPDLHIVGHNRQMVLELKSDHGESRPEQRQWIREYQSAGVDARFVYPEDLDDVLEELRRGAAA